MHPKSCLRIALFFLPLPLALGGCRGSDWHDTLVASAANPSHTYRATILLRQYFVDGKVDTSPTTYVLLDKDSARPDYSSRREFKDSQVVMKPSQCGALDIRWADDHLLKVVCEKCGIALSEVGKHANGIGPIRIEYEGFPVLSSWESGPSSN